jgi:hypothetical protein
MEPRRLLAIPQGMIAVGIAFRLHTMTAHGAADIGLWVAILLSLIVAIGCAAIVSGAVDQTPAHYQAAGSLYLGITLIAALTKRHAPPDAQLANLLIFGGIGLAELAAWYVTSRGKVTA